MHLCKALDNIEKAAVRKGIKQGRKQGRKQGEKQGEKRDEGKGTLTTLFSLVNDGLFKLDEAAKRTNLSKQAFCSGMKRQVSANERVSRHLRYSTVPGHSTVRSTCRQGLREVPRDCPSGRSCLHETQRFCRRTGRRKAGGKCTPPSLSPQWC